MQALRWVTWAEDGRSLGTQLTEALLAELQLEHSRDLVGWIYRSDKPPIREIAALAPLVLEIAEGGDPIAYQLIWGSAEALAEMGRSAAKKLGIEKPDYAFAGGLLEVTNLLSKRLCEKLNLPDIPQRLHPPVIGAALLALNHLNKTS
jgi:N-acetylglucosamine kinase-like BadF-type ATPase